MPGEVYGEAGAGGRPGMILFVQTFGDLVTFNPHIHVLAADGVFREDGVFIVLKAIPAKLLERRFRSEVLQLLIREGAVSKQLAASLLAWRHSGFSVHNAVRVRAHDSDGRKRLAQYMLRAPFALEKMTYDAGNGMVIYRSHLHKSLKRNFQLMTGVEWLELLCRHIPDRFEHLVRYMRWYSNRCRGERARAAAGPTLVVEDTQAHVARARSAWARLIYKVYEVDPLACPLCKGPMRVIALIEDPGVIRKILGHLGLWAPPATKNDTADSLHSASVLTYHPVPDIA